MDRAAADALAARTRDATEESVANANRLVPREIRSASCRSSEAFSGGSRAAIGFTTLVWGAAIGIRRQDRAFFRAAPCRAQAKSII